MLRQLPFLNGKSISHFCIDNSFLKLILTNGSIYCFGHLEPSKYILGLEFNHNNKNVSFEEFINLTFEKRIHKSILEFATEHCIGTNVARKIELLYIYTNTFHNLSFNKDLFKVRFDSTIINSKDHSTLDNKIRCISMV